MYLPWGRLAVTLCSLLQQFPLGCVRRTLASQTEGELKVTQILKDKFPRATVIQVTDISGKAFSLLCPQGLEEGLP